MIRHKRDGLLVRCGDVDGLAEALVRLAEEEGLRKRLGLAGRERTRREFGSDERALYHDGVLPVTTRTAVADQGRQPFVFKLVLGERRRFHSTLRHTVLSFFTASHPAQLDGCGRIQVSTHPDFFVGFLLDMENFCGNFKGPVSARGQTLPYLSAEGIVRVALHRTADS